MLLPNGDSIAVRNEQAMSIRGGSTTQSGIYFQNTIAALYMGRMLDPRVSDLTQQVVSVRSEARDYVDDVVVVFADGHLG